MISIIIPTLDREKGQRAGRLAVSSSGVEDVRVDVIVDKDKERFTKTVNRGLRNLERGEWPCILNDDVYKFQPGWLRNLEKAIRYHHAGASCPSGRSHTAPMKEGVLGMSGVQKVRSIPFWCVLIRRKALDSVGLLDESFVHFASDNDWCERANRAGVKLLWVKSVFLWHEGHGSGRLHKLAKKDSARFRRKWR